MPVPDSTYSTLQNIQTKVRRLTRSPSTAQLADADLNQYINNFVLYDFPEHLRLFNLKTTLTFYTTPNVDTYSTNTINPTDPLYNFVNQYTTVHPPFYVAGYEVSFTQSREQFYGIYPNLNSLQTVAYGDGSSNAFTGVVNLAGASTNVQQTLGILKNNVTFGAQDNNGNALVLVDQPQSGTTLTGNLFVPNNFSAPTSGTINYITGVFTLVFATPPMANTPIYCEFVQYQATIPQSILFYDGIFTLRPVPDMPYPVQMDAYIRPTQLINSTDIPGLSEWWQYIAYGAAKKIFEDRMDVESVQMILPEYLEQRDLIQRRTLVQNTNRRTATIYTEQTGQNLNNSGFGFGSSGGF